MTEMKGHQSIGESNEIEEVFMNSFWEEVNKFHVEESDENDEKGVLVEKPRQAPVSVSTTPTSNLNLDLSNNDEREENSLLSTDLMGEMDALLSMAFEQYATDTTHHIDTVVEIDEESNNCHKLYEK